MPVFRSFIFLAAAVALYGCGQDDASSDAEPLQASRVSTAAETAPVEGMSFRGDPLYRNAVDAERLASLQAEIDAAELNSSKSEDDYIRLGHLYIESNRFKDSVDLYTRGLKEYPDSYKLRRHRGHRYINLRQLDNAIVDLEEALELIGSEHGDALEYNARGEPTATYEHWVWYHVGLYHYLNENWESAAAAYQNCVATAISNSNRVGATDWLYNAYMKGGMTSQAQEAIDGIAADIDTNREHPYFKRVMVYKGELDPAEVIDIDKPAADWNGFDITVGYGIGNWYRFRGDAATADTIHAKILETPYWNSWAYVVTDREFSRR